MGGNSKFSKPAFPVVRKSQRVTVDEEGEDGDDDEDGEGGDGVVGIGLSNQDWEVTSANDTEEDSEGVWGDDDDGGGGGGGQALSLENMDEDDLLGQCLCVEILEF